MDLNSTISPLYTKPVTMSMEGFWRLFEGKGGPYTLVYGMVAYQKKKEEQYKGM
jgi:hypothetical protein